MFMPRNKVLEKAKVNISASRSAFDCSHERSQTAIAGDIQVVYAQPFVKGTNGKINVESFTRTASVVAPAFYRVTEHIDFFKVPLHAIWRYWENFKLNLNDMQDTNLVPWNSSINQPDMTIPQYAPRMDYYALCRSLYGSQIGSTLSQMSSIARNMNDVMRLCDEVRISDKLVFYQNSTPTGVSRILSLFMPAAYQKIYFEHYRNTAYESNNPYAYNLDWLTSTGQGGLLSPDDSDSTKDKHTYVARELFKRRRVNYRNDYFHNIYPALNYVLSAPSGLNFSLPSNIGQLSFASTSNNVIPQVNASNGTVAAKAYYTSTAFNTVSVQNIRAAFALDKLMRAAAYAPKHVREQYKAQFGVDGEKYDKDMCSERLGSFQSEIAFQEVTNMAESTSAALGDLGSKGVGLTKGQKDLSFYCDDDCIIMGLRYFMPRSRYDADGLHPWNVKIAREDFYQKAFENLGLRPFYYYNIDATAANMASQVGWSVPNFEYKILPDLNFDCFKDTFCDYWATQTGQTISITQSANTQDILRCFVPHTSQVASASLPVSADYFKVAAEDLNNVFAVPVQESHQRSVYQFYSNIRVKCAIVAPMSVHGQPSL